MIDRDLWDMTRRQGIGADWCETLFMQLILLEHGAMWRRF
jgi:hypothetical protein